MDKHTEILTLVSKNYQFWSTLKSLQRICYSKHHQVYLDTSSLFCPLNKFMCSEWSSDQKATTSLCSSN